jgi:hypothetical protein
VQLIAQVASAALNSNRSWHRHLSRVVPSGPIAFSTEEQFITQLSMLKSNLLRQVHLSVESATGPVVSGISVQFTRQVFSGVK